MNEIVKFILDKVADCDWLIYDFEVDRCSYCDAAGEWDEGNIIIEHKPDCIVTMAARQLSNADKPAHQTTFIKSITVQDPDTGNDVDLEIRKDNVTGAVVGIDGSYLSNTEDIVFDPYNQGATLNFNDDENKPTGT